MFAYQNPALPVECRVKDLLSRMALEEKTAQTRMKRGVEYATKPDPKQTCSVEPDTGFKVEKLLEGFSNDGMGFIHDMYSTPVALNKIQRHFVKHSQLGIPAVFTGKALHGISGIRGAVFPSPVNYGATFDPELVHRWVAPLVPRPGLWACMKSWLPIWTLHGNPGGVGRRRPSVRIPTCPPGHYLLPSEGGYFLA